MDEKKILKMMIVILLASSVALLSLFLMIGKITNVSKMITLIVSFGFSGWYLYKNYDKIYKQIKTNKIDFFICLVASLIIFYELTDAINDNIMNRFYNLKGFYYLIIPGIWFVITVIFGYIKSWLKDFFKKMSKIDKKIYIFTSLVMFILLIIMYSFSDYFYLQFDEIYSMDSGWVYQIFVPNPHYYDVRHPITSILVFPVYAIVNFIFNSQLKPIVLQFINIQLLIITGLELKRLTNNKWVFIFYMCSFPAMLFSLFFEKYILSIFLMTTYLYNIFINKKNSYTMLILSIGTMATNIFIAMVELFRRISIKEKIKNINMISLMAILIIIISGRIHCFTGCFQEISELKEKFATADLTIGESFNSTVKMIEQSFIAIPSSHHIFMDGKEYRDVYLWNNLTGTISYGAMAILAIILCGVKEIIKEKKEKYLAFLLTLGFSFILFMGFNWSVDQSPLFSICFSWAIIPLFIYGFDKILRILKIKEKYHKYIYIGLIGLMIVVNIVGFIDMYRYVISF